MSSAPIAGFLSAELSEELEVAGPQALLKWGLGLRPASFLRRTPNRETFFAPGGSDLVVKRSIGSGPRDDWWFDRLRGARRSPTQREYENLQGLGGAGVPVPRALAWASEQAACGYPWRFEGRGGRGVLVMARVDFESTLFEALDRRIASPREFSEPLALSVAAMHRAGWYYRDLYLHHWVVKGDSLRLLDVGRARHEPTPRERWFVKDLAALLSTVPESVHRSDRLRFLRQYCVSMGRTLDRRFLRAIEAKSERIRAHRPRFIEPGGRLDEGAKRPVTAEHDSKWETKSVTS